MDFETPVHPLLEMSLGSVELEVDHFVARAKNAFLFILITQSLLGIIERLRERVLKYVNRIFI